MEFESEKEILNYACDKFLEVIDCLDKEKLNYVFVKKVYNENLNPKMFLVFKYKHIDYAYFIIYPKIKISNSQKYTDDCSVYYSAFNFYNANSPDFETLTEASASYWGNAIRMTKSFVMSEIENNKSHLFYMLNVNICTDCGKLIYERGWSVIEHGSSRVVCDECYNKYEFCECCREHKLKENIITLSDGSKLCSECFKNSDIVVEDCLEPGKFINKYKGIFLGDNKYTTLTSIKSHKDLVCKCALCNRYFLKENNTKKFGRHYVCESCLSDNHTEIKGYHNNPKRIYFGEKCCSLRPRKFKGFGIELEVQKSDPTGSTEDARRKIKEILGEDPYQELYFMRDGSIGSYGFEIITQPHEEKSLLKINWEKILSQLKSMGYRSHNGNACGLHIHSSRSLYGDTKAEQNDNIAKVIYFYEKNFDELFKFSRRTETQWCHSYKETLRSSSWLRDSYCYNGEITRDVCERIARSGGLSRYHAVNVTNRNTIEFRIFRGTLVLDTFLSTLDLTFNIVRNCKNISWEEIDDISKWLSGVNATTKEYIKSRNCFEGVIE